MPEEERSVLDWFEEGREARLCHIPKEHNPYPAGEQSHEAWARGWIEADGSNDKTKGYS